MGRLNAVASNRQPEDHTYSEGHEGQERDRPSRMSSGVGSYHHRTLPPDAFSRLALRLDTAYCISVPESLVLRSAAMAALHGAGRRAATERGRPRRSSPPKTRLSARILASFNYCRICAPGARSGCQPRHRCQPSHHQGWPRRIPRSAHRPNAWRWRGRIAGLLRPAIVQELPRQAYPTVITSIGRCIFPHDGCGRSVLGCWVGCRRSRCGLAGGFHYHGAYTDRRTGWRVIGVLGRCCSLDVPVQIST